MTYRDGIVLSLLEPLGVIQLLIKSIQVVWTHSHSQLHKSLKCSILQHALFREEKHNNDGRQDIVISLWCFCSLVSLSLSFLSPSLPPTPLFFLWHTQPTSDDLVSSAECSSDDEDFVECEPSTGRLGQSCFACFFFTFAKNNTYIYVTIHVFYIYYSVLMCVFTISIYV